MKRQLLRAASSIPANIVEGFGGDRSGKTYRNYLTIARRSALETNYLLLLANDLDMLAADTYQQLNSNLSAVIAMLVAMIKKMRTPTTS